MCFGGWKCCFRGSSACARFILRWNCTGGAIVEFREGLVWFGFLFWLVFRRVRWSSPLGNRCGGFEFVHGFRAGIYNVAPCMA